MLKILTVPNPILRTRVKLVAVVSKRIKKLAQQMAETLIKLKDPPGVGLAAPQVGVNFSLFVFRNKNRITTVINPKLLSHSQEEVLDVRNKHTMLEGCLSIPRYYGKIKRFNDVKISYLDENGKEHLEEFKAPEAIIIQHEMDHLEGKLFVDKLLEQKGKLYKVENPPTGEDKEEMREVEI